MKKYLLLFLFIFFKSFFCFGNSYIIEPSKNKFIKELLKSKNVKKFSISQLDHLLQEIYKTRKYYFVYIEKISKKKVRIVYEENKTLNEIQITGNKFYKKNEIINQLNLSLKKKVNYSILKKSIDKLKKYYTQSGFYATQINFNISFKNRGIIFKIDIKENKRALIRKIEILSDNLLLRKKTFNDLKKYINSTYTSSLKKKILNEIRDSFLKNRFLSSKISEIKENFNSKKTDLNLLLSINNLNQFEFIFTGNKKFTHFELLKQIEIGQNPLYLPNSDTRMIENIYKLYQKNGYSKVKIHLLKRKDIKKKKNIFIFQISEGPRIKLRFLEIFGNISKSKYYYIDIFKKKLPGSHVYFVEKNTKIAAQSLINFLRNRGYLQARLISLDVEYISGNFADLILHIDEGSPVYVREILFNGSKFYSPLALKKIVDLKTNTPLIVEQVENSFSKLENFYKEQGYLDFLIKNKNHSVIDYRLNQPYVDIIYHLYEGPKVKVKEVVIRGLKKTKKSVILNEIEFSKGDILSLSKITKSVNRLEKMGIFSKASIQMDQKNNEIERTVFVNLEERKPGVFSSGLGFFNDGLLTYRGFLGVAYNNLFGLAHGLGARLDIKYRNGVNYFENRINVSYYQPFLFGERIRGRISFVREQELFEFIPNNSRILSKNDVILSTQQDFFKHLRFTYNVWKFSNQSIFDMQNQIDSGTINIATTGPILELDYRNHPFLPVKGSYTRLDLEVSHPLIGSSQGNPNRSPEINRIDPRNEINFIRTTLSTTFYTPLNKNQRWVWVQSLRGGYLKNMSLARNSGVPTTKSFFLGGNASIRGFARGTTETIPSKRELCLKKNLFPEGADISDTDQCDFSDIYVNTDSSYLLIRSEIRFPIYEAFGGLVFYDGGAVWVGDVSLQDPYRDSVGVGLRYDTPAGPFTMSFGYKLDRKQRKISPYYDDEGGFALHFSIGSF